MIRDCIACELAYINTDHPSFIGGNRAIAAVLEDRAGGGSSGSDEGGEPAAPNGESRPAAQRSPLAGACPEPCAPAPFKGGGCRESRTWVRALSPEASSELRGLQTSLPPGASHEPSSPVLLI